MDHQKRLNLLREQMERQGLRAYITTPDANMQYLTGLPRLGGGATKQRQHSIEYACLVVTESDAVACLPNLSCLITQAKLGGKTAHARLHPFPDGDTDGVTITAFLKGLGLSGAVVGVTQDVSAAMTLLLQGLGATVRDCNDIIFSMRAVKDKEELALIRKGVEITDRLYHDICGMIHPGANVRELEWAVEQKIEVYGASGSSFPAELNTHGPNAGPFVGFSAETIQKGDVIGLDYGVIYGGYCTDFGRTIFVGEPKKEHLRIYELVRQAQAAAMEQMIPGSCGEKADNAARDVITQGGFGERFIHKLGHAIGLDVHERPFLAKGETGAMLPGMIYAVEPSVFLPRECFIRLEDQVAITETGNERYSAISQEVVVID